MTQTTIWGITLLSCLGKLFSAVLNNRINSYVEMYGCIGEEKAGFILSICNIYLFPAFDLRAGFAL